jgi:hypothetical protein
MEQDVWSAIRLSRNHLLARDDGARNQLQKIVVAGVAAVIRHVARSFGRRRVEPTGRPGRGTLENESGRCTEYRWDMAGSVLGSIGSKRTRNTWANIGTNDQETIEVRLAQKKARTMLVGERFSDLSDTRVSDHTSVPVRGE